MDLDSYRDIAPYRGQDFEDAKQRLLASREYLASFVYLLAGGEGDEKTKAYLDGIFAGVARAGNYSEFQSMVTAGVLVPTVIGRTMKSFSSSGVENIDPEKGYLFISNHRDIILDCALLDYALLTAGKPLCEMAFGDNLILNQFVEDLFRLNGGVIVRRDLPMREKYLESRRLSSYFVELVTEAHRSIWVAQKSGRSKDGIDETHSSIIKMLYLSKRGSGMSFSELINRMNIVPVSISYEYDPNDINKGREEVLRQHHDGAYEKKRYEDLISMSKGMKCPKGRVHLSIGTPLSGDFETPEEVAREIDRQIHLSYKLWDTNMFAYDYLEGSGRYRQALEGFDGKAFLSHFAHLTPEVRSFVLNSYANPVRMALKEMA